MTRLFVVSAACSLVVRHSAGCKRDNVGERGLGNRGQAEPESQGAPRQGFHSDAPSHQVDRVAAEGEAKLSAILTVKSLSRGAAGIKCGVTPVPDSAASDHDFRCQLIVAMIPHHDARLVLGAAVVSGGTDEMVQYPRDQGRVRLDFSLNIVVY